MSRAKLLGTAAAAVSLVFVTGCQPLGYTPPPPVPGYVVMDNVKQPGDHIYIPANPYLDTTPGRYIALGDSFSSGEGNPPFLLGTAAGTSWNSDSCHRSVQAYSQVLGIVPGQIDPPKVGTPKPDELDFVACSGATIQAVWHKNRDNTTEYPQGNRLALGEDPSKEGASVGLITMSMGGNNVGFSDIISSCMWNPAKWTLLPIPDSNPCSVDAGGRPSKLQHTLDVDLNYIDGTRAENSARCTLPGSDCLEQLYLSLRHDAPNARILIVGYPREFPKTPKPGCQHIDSLDQTWANEQISDRLDDVIMRNINAANASDPKAKIEYVDTVPAFLDHAQCTDNSGFNGFDSPQMYVTDHSGFYHPNGDGNMYIGQAVMACLGKPQMECGMPPLSNIQSPKVSPVPPPNSLPHPSPTVKPPDSTIVKSVGCGSDGDTFLQFMKDQGAKVKDALGPPECLDGYAEQDFTFTDTSPTANYPTFFFQKDSSPAGWRVLGGGAVGDASSICKALPANVRTLFTRSDPNSDSGCPVGVG